MRRWDLALDHPHTQIHITKIKVSHYHHDSYDGWKRTQLQLTHTTKLIFHAYSVLKPYNVNDYMLHTSISM